MKSPHDIFFLSFDEENAEENWRHLLARYPQARRVHGIPGILPAHQKCASLSGTSLFYVIDGDNQVLENFDFSYSAHASEHDHIHVWRCLNPVNDLVYGYGAVKLFPRELFTGASFTVDLSTSLTRRYKIMPTTASITHFNTSAKSAWRAGFRECVKLASQAIISQKPEESSARLNDWCTKGKDRPYGDWCIAGATAGREYGTKNQGDAKALSRINDFFWLDQEFERIKDGKSRPTI